MSWPVPTATMHNSGVVAAVLVLALLLLLAVDLLGASMFRWITG